MMLPSILWKADLPRSAEFVAMQLFQDPRRPLDRAFLDALPPYGITVKRRMTARTFRRAVDQLRQLGLVEGDRVPEPVIRQWEDQWRRDRRESRRTQPATRGAKGGES